MSSVGHKSGTKAFVLVFSKVLTLLLSTVTAMILSRALTLNEYGTYSELLTVSSLGVSIFSLGLPNALNYFLPQRKTKEEKGNFLGFYFTVVTIISLVIMVCMALLNRQIAGYYKNPALVLYSYFLVIIPWTKLIISSRSNMLVAEGYVNREVVYCILNGLCLVVISLLLSFTEGSFAFYLFLYVVIECVFALGVYFEALRISERKINIRLNWQDIKAVLVYTIPLGLSTAISTISLDLDKLIIGYFMDESSVAIYANAGKELPFSLISTSFTAVFLPQIVLMVKEKKAGVAVEKWKDIMSLNYIILAFCVGASVVFAPQIITLLYSDTYLAGVGIFRIYSFTLLLRITYWGMMLNAHGRTNEILYNSIICLAVNVALSFVFYKTIGFAGPALATILSILAISVLQVVRSSRLLGVSLKNIIPYRQFALPTVAVALSGGVMCLLMKVLCVSVDTKSILTVVMLGIVWGVCYVLAFLKHILRLWKRLNDK